MPTSSPKEGLSFMLKVDYEDNESEGSSGSDDSPVSVAPGQSRSIAMQALCSPLGRSAVLMLIWILTGVLGLSGSDMDQDLYWIDIVYLQCQIITTVGYGDLPPPTTTTQFCFYTLYVLSACMLVAQVVGMLVGKVVEPAQSSSEKAPSMGSPRFRAFMKAFLIWTGFVVTWACFFYLHPDEENVNTLAEALYMGVITLTTVGFGDYVPTTHYGKLFASCWILLGTGAFTIMIGKFGVWTFFLFNKMSVDKLDAGALQRITETQRFKGVATARANVIEQLLQDFEFEKYKEVSRAYAEKISRNDFLVFMIVDMGLVDVEMIDTLSSHFDKLDITGEGYIDREDLEKAVEEELALPEGSPSKRFS